MHPSCLSVQTDEKGRKCDGIREEKRREEKREMSNMERDRNEIKVAKRGREEIASIVYSI